MRPGDKRGGALFGVRFADTRRAAVAGMDLSQNLEIATCTDPGMVRSHNEDSIAADPGNGLVVLADGMGGYNAGEVASGMATTVIVTEMRQILQIDSGIITPEQAKKAQHKNLVTKALGIDPTVEPEIHEYPTKAGDIFLLCSDGLCDMVEDEDIGMTLQTLGGNLKLAAQQLVQMANDNGGRDNVSVILVRVLREYPGRRGVMGKVFGWLK